MKSDSNLIKEEKRGKEEKKKKLRRFTSNTTEN